MKVGHFFLVSLVGTSAYTPRQPTTTPRQTTIKSEAVASRRDVLESAALFGLIVGGVPGSSLAFDGTGSTASSGLNAATKAERKKAWRERIAADMYDFNVLGKSIELGETEGKAWVNFFIQFQRREPDEVGRAFAALADLRGLPTKKRDEYEGGDALLLANTFTKAGKPPDNTPAVKSFKKVAPTFDAIEAAGKKGDAKKAKEAFDKTKVLLEQYLADVEMPSSLSDPLYN